MCLELVTSISRGSDQVPKVGFKVFERLSGYRTVGAFAFPYREEFMFERGEWLNAHHVVLQASRGDKATYVSGFHIFTNKADAFKFAKTKRWWTPAVFEVNYIGVLATGTTKNTLEDDRDLDTVVADRMLIVEEVQEDPGPDFDVCL